MDESIINGMEYNPVMSYYGLRNTDGKFIPMIPLVALVGSRAKRDV